MSERGWPKPKTAEQSELRDASRGRRLHKVLAEAGIGSRRACEALIESGVVEVNGTLVTRLPVWVDAKRDTINVNGERIQAPRNHVYVLLNKPRGIVCTNDDPQGRRRAIDIVLHPTRARLYPVGRLDADSGGLLLLTNDGELTNRLTHPRYGVHKVYEVTIDGTLDREAVSRLERGIFLPERDRRGRRTSRSRVKIIRSSRDRTHLRFELREGRNRQLRRMLLRLGYQVTRLTRVELGPLNIRDLKPGQWRDLMPPELTALQRTAYRRETKEANVQSRARSKANRRAASERD